jgi:transglutaminase-like putative cysteine protease
VRAALPHRTRTGMSVPIVAGLTARAISDIARYEWSSLWPGAVARALAEWKRTVYGPVARILQDSAYAGCPCCDPLEHRDVLAQALASLGVRPRRELEVKVSALDDVFERRTYFDPQTPPEWPWWRRRA